MHRLLVPHDMLERENTILPRDAAHHLAVVRAKPGERIELFDGAGCARFYSCGASPAAPLAAAGEMERFPALPYRLVLFACVTKGSRWDWTIEKSVELGVSKIVPVISERCIAKIAQNEKQSKRERWMRIASEAARQSDAKWLPEIAEPVRFAEAAEIARKTVCFAGILSNPPPPPFAKVFEEKTAGLQEGAEIGVFTGPEGDFSPKEKETLSEIAVPANFGPTILRAETAAMFAVAVMSALLHLKTHKAETK